MTADVKEIFNRLASTYKQDIDEASPYNAYYERPSMMEALPAELQGKKVLDAGCSAGWYASQIVKQGAEVTGIDLSPNMIKEAKKRNKEERHATFMCHDLQKELPFKDHSFDVIVSSLTLHYIKDWTKTFQEFDRVLKPGGMFLFSVHHPFMDHKLNKAENYFKKQSITDTWKKPNLTIDVQFYRRSMQSIVNSTTNLFMLEKLIEPQPCEILHSLNEKTYHHLMTNPHFLIVKAKSQKVSAFL